MSLTEARFTVISVSECPFYKVGDEFKISGNALLIEHKEANKFIATVIIDLPAKRRECRPLIAELNKVLITHERVDRIPDALISCPRCQGEIQLEYKRGISIALVEDLQKYSDDVGAIASLLGNFSIFRTLAQDDLRDLVSLLRLKKFRPGDAIITKGDPGKNLFIILSGKVNVVDEDGVSITKLQNGEVFGEMSLISGDPVGATIRVIEPTTVLFIRGQDFLKVLNRFPSLQMYFARLLSRRLAESNVMMSKEYLSGMTGTLNQMPLVELFQTLNFNQKTGTLKLNLSQGSAQCLFNAGSIIHAEYGSKRGKDAFFNILSEKEGRFQFVPGLGKKEAAKPKLGMFMELLMEGLRLLDEDRAAVH